MLATLNVEEVLENLLDLMLVKTGNDVVLIALVSYEKPNEFSHRKMVAEWLTKAGYATKEW